MARRCGTWPMLVLALACSTPAAPVRADYADQEATRCERAIVAGAAREGVPQAVLHAISLTETGRRGGGQLRPWPWAINREGRGHWFRTRDEALAFARASVAAGRYSFDVGCFQINFHWHGHKFSSLEAMFDPDVGASYAAQFLRGLHAERGDWSAAAGAYHSQTPARARTYRARFDRIVAGLGAPLVMAAATPEGGESRTPRRSRTRMASKPLIITLAKATPAADAEGAARQTALVPVETGWLPATGSASVPAAGWTPPGPADHPARSARVKHP